MKNEIQDVSNKMRDREGSRMGREKGEGRREKGEGEREREEKKVRGGEGRRRRSEVSVLPLTLPSLKFSLSFSTRGGVLFLRSRPLSACGRGTEERKGTKGKHQTKSMTKKKTKAKGIEKTKRK